MLETTRLQRYEGHHAEPRRRFQVPSVSTHVLRSGFGITRHDTGRREVGSGIEAGGGDRHRQGFQAIPGPFEVASL